MHREHIDFFVGPHAASYVRFVPMADTDPNEIKTLAQYQAQMLRGRAPMSYESSEGSASASTKKSPITLSSQASIVRRPATEPTSP